MISVENGLISVELLTFGRTFFFNCCSRCRRWRALAGRRCSALKAPVTPEINYENSYTANKGKMGELECGWPELRGPGKAATFGSNIERASIAKRNNVGKIVCEVAAL